MELRVLRYFLAVVREETISGAAETLHVTQPTPSRQLKELEEEMCIRDSAKGVLVDVRGNMDGSVPDAVSMLDEILPEGLAAYTVDKENKRDELTVDADYFDLPLVVLVDGNSASAAEVFAGAVQGRGRGQVIGTQTYGKGVVQSIVDMPYSGGGVKLTSALYYTPDEKAVNGGITPDIAVSNPEAVSYTHLSPTMCSATWLSISKTKKRKQEIARAGLTWP